MGFTPEEQSQFAAHGVPVEEVARQVHLFEHPPGFMRLERACSVGDGIRQLSKEESAAAESGCEQARNQGRLMKFVPASGAATRMFQALLAARTEHRALRRSHLETLSVRGDGIATEMVTFMDGWARLPFRNELSTRAAAAGRDADALAAAGDFTEIVDVLLKAEGLDYAALPKGVLPFHMYADGVRTAFEEHLIDAARWMSNGRECRLHFTVSPEHQAMFARLAERACARYQRELGIRFVVTFSTQKHSTDTVAVDLDNRLFRTADGQVLFRPGGHGALIENLADLAADIVFIENIDNVVPDHLKEETMRWKRLLCGHLVVLQRRVFDYLGRLQRDDVKPAIVSDALVFAREQLDIVAPPALADGPIAAQREFLVGKLNRPLRICGMVPNVGEPGGGPFWVHGSDGVPTPQIVESAQVDSDDAPQRSIFNTATHFNPVELACGLRDWQGEPFALDRYLDPNAVFIARKSKDGRALKALERPGLWNGAMADWTTVFVEVPGLMFNPVKTVNDLLRPQHQPSEQRS